MIGNRVGSKRNRVGTGGVFPFSPLLTRVYVQGNRGNRGCGVYLDLKFRRAREKGACLFRSNVDVKMSFALFPCSLAHKSFIDNGSRGTGGVFPPCSHPVPRRAAWDS